MTLNSSEIEAMQATVEAVQLDHTCTISRDRATGTDRWNNKTPALFVPYLEDLACHYWINTATVRPIVMGTPDLVLDRLNLVVPADTDVTERDRIDWVKNADGAAITGPLLIREVRKRLNHIHLVLHEVR